MNILIITYQGGLAGSTFSISYLAKGLAARGHNVYVGYKGKPLLYDLLKNTAVELVQFPFKGRFDLASIKQLKNLVQEKNIQIINAQSSLDRFVSMLAKKLYRLDAKVVHTRRQRPNSSGGKLHGKLYTWGTDRIVAVSKGVKDRAVEFMGISPDHIKVIHNGTPPEKYENVAEQDNADLKNLYNIDDNDFVIGCISRHKQQEQLVKALNYIPQPEMKLLLVGLKEGDLDLNAADFPDQHQIIFSGGRIEPEEALRHYKLFDIHVLPSITEGLSQSLLEAMFLNIPNIATAAAGNPDLIEHGNTGLLFESGDLKELAAQILELKENHNLRDKIIKNAKQRVIEDFSIDNVVKNYENFFRELI